MHQEAQREDAMVAMLQRLRVEVMARVEKLCSEKEMPKKAMRKVFFAWKLLMEKVKLHRFYQERWKRKPVTRHSLQWTWAAWRFLIVAERMKHKRLVEKRHARDGQRAKWLDCTVVSWRWQGMNAMNAQIF